MSIDLSAFECDTHMHTVASTHAYSTVLELAQYAHRAGIKIIAVTDHGPALPDAPHPWHFACLRNLPGVIEDVRVLGGIEANIVDFDGSLDLDSKILARLDWVIASFHQPACPPGTAADHTRAYLRLAENPLVDVIGHSGTEDFKYDYEKVIPVFGQKGKLVEINSHSFSARAGAPENCRAIAELCKKHRVPIVVNSDAHSCFSVGDLGSAVAMLNAIGFPEELVINYRAERLISWLRGRKERRGA